LGGGGGGAGTHKLRRPVLERQYASAVRALYTKLGDSGSDHPEPLSMDRHGVSPSGQSASRHRAKSIIASVASIALSDSKALGGPLATILPDSLAALRAIGLLNREFNKNFPVTVLLEAGATIDSVTALLLSSGVDSVELDPSTLESDARAADNIAPVPWSVAKAPCGVQVALLTGSTGFVGTFLLAEMLHQLPAQSKVFCIVRAPTAAAGVSRLQEQLALSGLLDACDVLRWRSRVVVLNGNLAAPALGLHAESWDSLASSVDLIVHCGAHVNSLLPYSVLRGANVDGTKELLRLACSRPSEACFMCHISTVGVLPPSALLPLKEGADVPVGHLSRANGYSQSKWVAETMVRRSFARGVSGCVIRPATVFCDSSSGYFNHTDFVVRSLRGMVELGAAPALGPQHVMADITPVNELARVTVALCTTAERRLHVHGRTLNVSSGQVQMAWLVEHLAACHSEIKMMPWRVWQTTLEASVDSEPIGTANALHPLNTFFRGHTFPGAIATDTAEAKATLLACGIDPPMPVTAATADTFIRRLAESLGRQI
jgi:thioester reductase-like protein